MTFPAHHHSMWLAVLMIPALAAAQVDDPEPETTSAADAPASEEAATAETTPADVDPEGDPSAADAPAAMAPTTPADAASASDATTATAPETDASAAPAAAAEARDREEGLFEQLIVTGTATAVDKFDTSYAVSSFRENNIELAAPLNTVDLLTQIPGFWAESSGGESGNNVFARGIPQDGSFRYVMLQEDGLPIFEEGETAFLNADVLFRLDASVDRVEAVRGGSSPVFASNAPGGTVNIISKKGTDTFEGLAKITWGDFDLWRFESNLSGPINEDLVYSIGGFYRASDGIRPTGFPADRGGQVRANATYRLDNGDITVYGRYLNDRNVFYLPIPLADPRDPTRSLEELIDPNTGTLASNDLRLVSLRRLNGTATGTTQQVDLGEGIHPDVTTVGATIDYELGAGWMLKDHARYTRGTVPFNALFSLASPLGAAEYLDTQLGRAQAAWPQTATVGYRVARTGAEFDPSATGGLVIESGWWSILMGIDNFINDLRLSNSFDTGPIGKQTITAGLYFSDYSLTTDWHFNTVLTEVRHRPQRLDVVAFDGTGAEVGRVTEDGFVGYGGFGVSAAVNARTWAGYLYDEWQVNDDLRFDFGVRHQRTDFSGSVANRTEQDLGDPTTLADDAVGGPDGSYNRIGESYHGTAFSVGTNVNVLDQLAVFGRFTRAFRIPDFENIYLDQGRDTEGILQGEIGVKLDMRTLSVFAVGFWSDFDSVSFSDEVIDPDTGTLVSLNFDGSTRTFGGELEAVWQPISPLTLSATATLQDPKYTNVRDLDTEREFAEFEGSRVRRIPSLLAALRASYDLVLFDRISLMFYGALQHIGDRYIDYANNTVLPSYQTVDAGLLATLDHRYSLQIHGSNHPSGKSLLR